MKQQIHLNEQDLIRIIKEAMSQDMLDSMDPHFDDDSQIQLDKERDWRDIDYEKPFYDSPAYADTLMDITPDYNLNVEGRPRPEGEAEDGFVKKPEGGYWHPAFDAGRGYIRAKYAMSDDPEERATGQAMSPTWRDFHEKRKNYFPADVDNTESYGDISSDGTAIMQDNGKIRESVKKIINKILKEALSEEEGNNSCLAIQTRTGLYELNLSFEKQSPDPEMVVYQGTVGQTMVNVMVAREAFENLKNQGISCNAKYQNKDMNTDWQDCTLSIYNK